MITCKTDMTLVCKCVGDHRDLIIIGKIRFIETIPIQTNLSNTLVNS